MIKYGNNPYVSENGIIKIDMKDTKILYELDKNARQPAF